LFSAFEGIKRVTSKKDFRSAVESKGSVNVMEYERDYSLAVSEDSLSHYQIKRNDIEMM